MQHFLKIRQQQMTKMTMKMNAPPAVPHKTSIKSKTNSSDPEVGATVSGEVVVLKQELVNSRFSEATL